jgi:hypothetical protein
MKDILETMRAELAEAVKLMRPHFPEDDESALLTRAVNWRQHRYQNGRWPDFAEVAKQEAEMLRTERIKQRRIKRKLRSGELVLWGDKWPDEVTSAVNPMSGHRGNERRQA